MAEPHDEHHSNVSPNRAKRQRSTRYPGVSLPDCLKLCESIEDLGVNGLSVGEIASALGYTNIKTNTFSARLSAARQFGLVQLSGEAYTLTPLARAILHPVDRSDLPQLHRQALLTPSLYAELAARFGGKRVPDGEILANILYHNHQIIASAKSAAAEAFLESADFAGALGVDRVFHPGGVSAPPETSDVVAPERTPSGSAGCSPDQREVRLDLQLWDEDDGKRIRLRAPQTITAASFERFLQAFQLLVRIEPSGEEGPRANNQGLKTKS
jgi:hypothetical protein